MSRKPTWTSEAEMARPLVRWLQFEGWVVYQEVRIDDTRHHVYGKNRADIVAERDGTTWVIETKRTLSLELLAQADAWRRCSRLVSIAVPPVVKKRYRNAAGRDFAFRVLRGLGIGVLLIHPPRDSRGIEVSEPIRPEPQSCSDHLNQKLRESLVPQRENFAEAGNAAGKFWTPFQESCSVIRDLVLARPGISLWDVINELGQLHYASVASARNSLASRIEAGVAHGIRGERRGTQLLLYPDEKCIDKPK